MKSEAEEVSDPAMEPERLVLENAGRKAREVAARVGGQEFVLGADTVVSIQGRIFGKPADAGDAKRMLRCLSGQVHMVSTGVALAHGGEAVVRGGSDGALRILAEPAGGWRGTGIHGG